jgi:hypothetical protein
MEFFECSRDDRRDWEDEAKGALVEEWETASNEIKNIMLDELCSVEVAMSVYLASKGWKCSENIPF